MKTVHSGDMNIQWALQHSSVSPLPDHLPKNSKGTEWLIIPDLRVSGFVILTRVWGLGPRKASCDVIWEGLANARGNMRKTVFQAWGKWGIGNTALVRNGSSCQSRRGRGYSGMRAMVGACRPILRLRFIPVLRMRKETLGIRVLLQSVREGRWTH
eukprot:scaffold380_cov332-Pavlova_lutheri.AAC.5